MATLLQILVVFKTEDELSDDELTDINDYTSDESTIDVECLGKEKSDNKEKVN